MVSPANARTTRKLFSDVYSRNPETLTAQDLVQAYRAAYFVLHDRFPAECQHVKGHWYVIEGAKRDQRWVIVETELMRQEALSQMLGSGDQHPTSRPQTLVRRLSGL